jgi:Flp pilus assembly protein TadD
MRTLFLVIGAILLGAWPAAASGGGGMSDPGSFAGPTPSGPTPQQLQDAYNDGVKAVDAQDWKKAISKFSYVTDANPNVADAWNYLAYASRKSGNFKRSEAAYKKALKLDPNHPRANEYYGELLLEENRIPEAEQRLAVLQTCCAADPVTAQLAGLIANAKAAPAGAPRASGGY